VVRQVHKNALKGVYVCGVCARICTNSDALANVCLFPYNVELFQ